jgi:hypothetical protein
MAKKKKHEGEGEETTSEYSETETRSEETSAEEQEKERREQINERSDQLIDGLKEKQKEHLDKAQEKLDAGKDATSHLAALQESNLQIRRLQAAKEAGIDPIPSGQERSGMGAAGTCVVGPEAHAYIESIGGEIVETDPPNLSGHASIELMSQLTPEEEKTREENKSRREEETADDEKAEQAA